MKHKKANRKVDEIPMIWTARGNLPIASLEYSTEWIEVPGSYTKLIETYKLDGEIVRQSAHVLARDQLVGVATGGQLC